MITLTRKKMMITINITTPTIIQSL